MYDYYDHKRRFYIKSTQSCESDNFDVHSKNSPIFSEENNTFSSSTLTHLDNIPIEFNN